MAIWDFLRKKDSGKQNGEVSSATTSFVQTGVGLVLKAEPSKTGEETNREHNIVLLYQFLDDNYENRGYNDALIYPDSNFLNQNIESLKNELFRTIKKVKTYYEDFITEIDFHIDSRSRTGMVETVEELKMKKKKAEDHLKKILEIESSSVKNEGESLGIVLSYTRGFQNGLAAITHHSILNRKL